MGPYGYQKRWGGRYFSASAWLLANTSALIVASGIANIYARDPLSSAAAQKGLNEQSGDRFLLGLGVSHVPLVEATQACVRQTPRNHARLLAGNGRG